MLEGQQTFSIEADGLSMAVSTNEALGALQVQGTLQQFVERINRLHEQHQNIAEGVKQVYLEAKAQGFDVKALRKVIADMRKDQDELKELEGVIFTYKRALNMQLELL